MDLHNNKGIPSGIFVEATRQCQLMLYTRIRYGFWAFCAKLAGAGHVIVRATARRCTKRREAPCPHHRRPAAHLSCRRRYFLQPVPHLAALFNRKRRNLLHAGWIRTHDSVSPIHRALYARRKLYPPGSRLQGRLQPQFHQLRRIPV